jgi:2-iminoacetate synthase
MEYAIPGFIEKFCSPNALLTLAEYLQDYATPETLAVGLSLIEATLDELPEGRGKAQLVERLGQTLREGRRDLYF